MPPEDLFDQQFFAEELSTILETSTTDPTVITESNLKSLFRCPYSYFLKNHTGMNKIPRSAFAAQSLFFEHAKKRLLKIRDSKIGRIFPDQDRAGPELKNLTEMTSAELKSYLVNTSPSAFGNSLKGTWLRITKNNTYAGNEMSWHFKTQPQVGASQLQQAGKSYYQFILEHGAPIPGCTNYETIIKWEGHKLKIKLPEIRTGMFIDQPTIWGFNNDITYSSSKNKLDTSSLVTLRILAYCQLASQYDLLRRKWGINQESVEQWQHTSLDETVTFRHLNCHKNELSETHRRPEDLDLLRRNLDHFLERITTEQFPPNHQYCSSCPYNALNLDGKTICPKIKKGCKPAVPMYYLVKENFEIHTQIEPKKILLTGQIRKDEFITKPVCSLELIIGPDFIDTNAVFSHYQSDAYGLGFEEIMLIKANQQLQELAKQKKTTLIHHLNFDRDFKYSGQKRIAGFLLVLGYQNNEKEYKPR